MHCDVEVGQMSIPALIKKNVIRFQVTEVGYGQYRGKKWERQDLISTDALCPYRARMTGLKTTVPYRNELSLLA